MTSNKGKIREITDILKDYKIKIETVKGEKTEIQSTDLTSIVKEVLLRIHNKSPLPLLVEDSGLFIKSLRGFPGPYSSYVFQTIGLSGVIKLMQGEKERSAEFRSVAGVYTSSSGIKVFDGIVKGEITEEPRGEMGFGFDPIFTPLDRGGKTFAEMSFEQKNQCSHRALSTKRFAEWFLTLSHP